MAESELDTVADGTRLEDPEWERSLLVDCTIILMGRCNWCWGVPSTVSLRGDTDDRRGSNRLRRCKGGADIFLGVLSFTTPPSLLAVLTTVTMAGGSMWLLPVILPPALRGLETSSVLSTASLLTLPKLALASLLGLSIANLLSCVSTLAVWSTTGNGLCA